MKRNTTQRAAWLIETPKRKVLYSGDGGYGVRYKRFGSQFPDIDLAASENKLLLQGNKLLREKNTDAL